MSPPRPLEPPIPSFVADVKPLFRLEDRMDMEFMFDLWDYDDVRREADNILQRIEDETMPCDAAWPDEKMAILRAWIDDGCQP